MDDDDEIDQILLKLHQLCLDLTLEIDRLKRIISTKDNLIELLQVSAQKELQLLKKPRCLSCLF